MKEREREREMTTQTYGLEGVGQELSDDSAAGASQAVDQRVRHLFPLLLLISRCLDALIP
jgi:hypothetical protein